MTGKPQLPRDPAGCWGGFNRQLGWCEKKPRPGCLTCWWHRDQEGAAKRLRDKAPPTGDERR